MSNGLNGVPSIGTKVTFTEDFLTALATGDESLDSATAAKRRETRANLTGKIAGSATISTHEGDPMLHLAVVTWYGWGRKDVRDAIGQYSEFSLVHPDNLVIVEEE